jgi:hypothetical protein
VQRLYLLFLLALVACGSEQSKAPESELRALLYCNQDWGNSPHRINNDGNPRCETPCATFSTLVHHEGCTLVAPTEIAGTTCTGVLTVEWEGWKGCCAPHSKDALGNFDGVKFVECE